MVLGGETKNYDGSDFSAENNVVGDAEVENVTVEDVDVEEEDRRAKAIARNKRRLQYVADVVKNLGLRTDEFGNPIFEGKVFQPEIVGDTVTRAEFARFVAEQDAEEGEKFIEATINEYAGRNYMHGVEYAIEQLIAENILSDKQIKKIEKKFNIAVEYEDGPLYGDDTGINVEIAEDSPFYNERFDHPEKNWSL